MRMAKHLLLALVTAPDAKTARTLARMALKARLVACANLVPRLESHYWWHGKLESATEVLVLFKTTTSKVKALEEVVLANHPYDTPEFVVLPVRAVNRRYGRWWETLGGRA